MPNENPYDNVPSNLPMRVYSTLQLTYDAQRQASARLSELSQSPAEMIRAHEELQGLLQAQRQRALDIGSLFLDLLLDRGGVDGALKRLMIEGGFSFADLLLEMSDEDEVEACEEAHEAQDVEEPEVSKLSDETRGDVARTEAEEAGAPPPLSSPTQGREPPQAAVALEELPKIERVITLPGKQLASAEEIQNLSFGSDFFGEQVDGISVWKEANKRSQSVEEAAMVFRKIGEMSRPSEVFGAKLFREEYAVIQRFSERNYISAWSTYGRRLLRCMVQHLSSRLRYLQDLDYGFRPTHANFEVIFGRFTDLVSSKPCGWVHGLKREHQPKGASWYQDALKSYEELMSCWRQLNTQVEEQLNPDHELDVLRQVIDEGRPEEQLLDQLDVIMSNRLIASDDSRLCGALLGHEELLRSYPSYKQLRKNIRRLRYHNEVEAVDLTPHQYTHLRAHFRGKRVILVGGDPRHQHLNRLQEHLTESKFEWIELSEQGGVRRIDNLCESVQRGGVDVLLVIQDFISHKVSIRLKEAVLQSERCESEMVTDGYGLKRLFLALEQLYQRTQIGA